MMIKYVLMFAAVAVGIGLISFGLSQTAAKPDASATQAVVMSMATATPRPSATAYYTPTSDPALSSQATAIALQKAQAEADMAKALAEQERLRAQMLQNEADTQAALNQAQVTLEENKALQVQLDAEARRKASAEAQAQTTLLAEQEAQIRARNAWIAAGIMAALGLVALIGLSIYVRRHYLQMKLEELAWRNESGFIQAEIDQRARPVTFHTQPNQLRRPVLPRGVTQEQIQRVARWVCAHDFNWSDEMRSGAGVGMSHALLVQYRSYLIQAGVLEAVNNTYLVTEIGRRYFAGMVDEQGEAEAPSLAPLPA